MNAPGQQGETRSSELDIAKFTLRHSKEYRQVTNALVTINRAYASGEVSKEGYRTLLKEALLEPPKLSLDYIIFDFYAGVTTPSDSETEVEVAKAVEELSRRKEESDFTSREWEILSQLSSEGDAVSVEKLVSHVLQKEPLESVSTEKLSNMVTSKIRSWPSLSQDYGMILLAYLALEDHDTSRESR